MSTERGASASAGKVRRVDLFIAGAWVRGGAGTRDVIGPAAEEPVAAVALADGKDVGAAVAGAAESSRLWSATAPTERGAILARAAALVRDRLEDLALALTLEQGKTLAESRGELGRAAETLAWNGEEAGRIEGTLLQGRSPGSTRRLVPRPVGIVAAFTAWNFPAVLVARKVGAALAAGCPVVLKAAEEAPMTAAGLVRCLIDAGLPRGVLSLVFGDPPAVARRLIEAPEIAAVSFTGSTRVGREIAALAAPGLKRCVLELGGHAATIVCADANVDHAVATTIPYKFTSAGQSCVAPSRFYVERARYDAFVERFTAAARAITVGDGRDPDVRMGPVANARRLQAMTAFTDDALRRGGRLLCGGRRLERRGYFFEPTVLADVPDEAAVMNDEPFGPIAPIAPFDAIDEAIERANRVPYGFAGYVFTESLGTASRIVEGLRAGNIGVNQMAPSLPDAPIGGLGHSGLGYEGGRRGIDAFLHDTLVSQTATG